MNLPFISKHISGAQDDRTFEHWRKHDSRHLHGCTLARFLNISVICLCCYVLDMFFKALNYKLEPHSICVTLEKQNSSLNVQDPRTASYCYKPKELKYLNTLEVICKAIFQSLFKKI